MCAILSVSRSSYYEFVNRKESKMKKETKHFLKKIYDFFYEYRGIYGAPKIHKLLINEGLVISLKRVQKIMKKNNLRSKIIKKWKSCSPKNKEIKERVNLLNQNFTANNLNEKWVTDITYIHTKKDGWCYLSTIQDLYSKKIISYVFSKKMDTDICLKTLKNACNNRKIKEGLILHSDLGAQYTSHSYEKALQDLKIRHSFSNKGCPYDNACIESFHATLKKEEVYQTTYQDFKEAKIALFRYIEGFYNRKRIHGSINFLTPEKFEKQSLQAG